MRMLRFFLTLSLREKFYFIPMVLVIIWLGVAPHYLLSRTAPSVERLIQQYQTKIGTSEASMYSGELK